jgi:hypothetical protein
MIRKGQDMMGSANKLNIARTNDPGTICMLVEPRDVYRQDLMMVVLANFSEFQKSVMVETTSSPLLREDDWTDLAQGKTVRLAGDPVVLGPYEILLLTRNTRNG